MFQLSRTRAARLVALFGAAAPLLVADATAALAKPPAQAPAWGYRRNQNDNDWNNRRYYTISGTVERDLGGDAFRFRTWDNRVFTVRAQNEPRRLNANDRVEIRGYFSGDTFYADSVRLTDQNSNGNYSGQNVNFAGVVTRIFGRREVEVRGDNGRTYRVRTNRDIPYGLNTNSRIRVTGSANGSTIWVEQLFVENGYNNGYSQNVDFPGRIDSINSTNRTVGIRGDNGVFYTVNSNTVSTSALRVGYRVRIRGTFYNRVVTATSITRI